MSGQGKLVAVWLVVSCDDGIVVGGVTFIVVGVGIVVSRVVVVSRRAEREAISCKRNGRAGYGASKGMVSVCFCSAMF